MSCQRCGAYSTGDLCRQCETELKFEDIANETASDSLWDSEEEEEGDD